MSEVISDKDYIRMVVQGAGERSVVETTAEAINVCSEKIKMQEGAIND